MCNHCELADDLDIPWPKCCIPGCDNEVPPGRFYHIRPTCMEVHANRNRTVSIIDMPKSNPLVVTSLAIAKGIGSSHKGNRQVF